MKHHLAVLLAAAGVVCGLASTQAKADDLQFSLHGERFSDGVLSGTFFGLAPSGTSSPTGVYITGTSYYDSYPSFSEHLGGPDFSTTGGFDIEDGQMVDGEFSFYDKATSDNLTLSTSDNSFSAVVEGKSYFTFPQDQVTEGGFMTFSVSAAPEPSTWLLMFAGVGGIGLLLRWAKTTTSYRSKDAFSA